MSQLPHRLKAQIPLSLPWTCRLLRAMGRALALGALLLAVGAAAAADARFDLAGPKIEVRVTRAGVTLPIASVPNLQPGDKLWLHPNLPATQSVHYLLVLAFLRGTTNPPPDNWFIRIEAWDKKVRAEGVEITVPNEAEQAVLFLAPVTGGDFSTLRSAVQGRPGIFVRASQDLNLAGFEQGRIEKYIAAMRAVPPAETADPKALLDHSNRIAETLALKPNPDCLKLPPDQQYICLTQSGNQTLLDDGHGLTIVDALTTGTSGDLIGQASYTQLAGGGAYSAYVGAIVDAVHIMGSLHTAQYQYIPAIAFPQQESLNLWLNTPPSFHNPKSVIVIGLPSVQGTAPPPLRPVDPKLVSCLAKPGLVLPVAGAPLVFSTGFAHDLVLHLNYPDGSTDAKTDSARPQDVPLTADPYQGGLVLAPIAKRRTLPIAKVSLPILPATVANSTAADRTAGAEASAGPPPPTDPPPADGSELTGTIQGLWGFDTFTGPTMLLETAPGKGWKLADDDPLIVSPVAAPVAVKDQHVLIASSGTACVQSIALDPAPAKSAKQTWKAGDQPNTIDVALNLSALPSHAPGTLHLNIRQFGDAKPATVSLVSYSEPARPTALEFHAGDTTATLTGSRLDEVRQVEFGGAIFTPPNPPATQPSGNSDLRLSDGAAPPKLSPGDKLTAQIALKDGRTLTLAATVLPARPAVTLIGRADVAPDSGAKPDSGLEIKLASPTDLPIADALMFSLKSAQPFPRAGQIEVASADDSLDTTLSVAGDSLILEDPHTILAKLEPLKAFGPSAFGPIRLRAVSPDGSAGDWLPLATLVRLPTLTGLSCPAASPASTSAPPAGPPASGREKPVSAPAAAAPSPTVATNSTSSSSPNPSPEAASAPPPCTLTGAGFYLIDALAADPAFTNPTRVPEGFVGSSLTVPAPTGANYYLRLRDDPTAANTVTLPTGPI